MRCRPGGAKGPASVRARPSRRARGRRRRREGLVRKPGGKGWGHGGSRRAAALAWAGAEGAPGTMGRRTRRGGGLSLPEGTGFIGHLRRRRHVEALCPRLPRAEVGYSLHPAPPVLREPLPRLPSRPLGSPPRSELGASLLPRSFANFAGGHRSGSPPPSAHTPGRGGPQPDSGG